jgi:anti-anti-sigma factor
MAPGCRRPASPSESDGTRSAAPHRVFDVVGQSAPGGVSWVWARTDLDMATVATARRELSSLLTTTGGAGALLVYLGSECFVDLRGLRLLVEVAAQLRSRGGALAVVAPPHCLRQMVRLGELGAQLPLLRTARHAASWARAHGSGDW